MAFLGIFKATVRGAPLARVDETSSDVFYLALRALHDDWTIRKGKPPKPSAAEVNAYVTRYKTMDDEFTRLYGQEIKPSLVQQFVFDYADGTSAEEKVNHGLSPQHVPTGENFEFDDDARWVAK